MSFIASCLLMDSAQKSSKNIFSKFLVSGLGHPRNLFHFPALSAYGNVRDEPVQAVVGGAALVLLEVQQQQRVVHALQHKQP